MIGLVNIRYYERPNKVRRKFKSRVKAFDQKSRYFGAIELATKRSKSFEELKLWSKIILLKLIRCSGNPPKILSFNPIGQLIRLTLAIVQGQWTIAEVPEN
ncbi:hypothetical protein AVEN_26315-1 [Araneus ventricosus]|uniref:Uncharacterized protein n=1 Tax=Araneus ventricosus TaxID=182803 RepID=A0A4Y2ALX2_ARAVE|nr:hypothetical protein AVEN_26315-1 [Araneus ventricosus]